ncbi:autotransporter domain-containing protein [Alisedimentitalea sp. MJ-SS2]|uniref:DUF7933 domain-containing protein n=1 Tax=Aliisedimentitalea sp. MJ-SS2 TaxID=3049795 RepID=UPI002910C8A8|nr:autotransporter domain-containing protein [Alisedimentitalea sp. MJ-SS2]MDU8929681.1 autotransporter domain-containing protein [Alisedimentitalea sp. MJ-SS2]
MTSFLAAGAAFLLSAGAAIAQAAPTTPTFQAALVPDTIAVGGASQITFTLDNSVGVGVRNLSFTANLPAAVTIGTGGVSTTCLGASAGGVVGSSTVTYTAGSMSPGAVCTLTAFVTSSTAGAHLVAPVTLTTDGGTSSSAEVTLTVDATRPVFNASFAPSQVSPGGSSVLTLEIDNTAVGSSDIGSLSFNGTLPPGIAIDPAFPASNTCSGAFGATFSADPATGTINLFANGFLPNFPALSAATSCEMTIPVKGTTIGEHTFVAPSVVYNATQATGPAAATLEVTGTAANAPLITKSYAPNPPSIVGANYSTQVTYTIANTSRDGTLSDLAFSDDYGAVMPGTQVASVVSNGCGGAVGTVGSGVVSLAGGTLGAGDCTIIVALTIPGTTPGGPQTITSTPVTGMIGATPVTGNTASATLSIPDPEAPSVTMSFTDAAIGADTTMSVTITNRSAVSSATGIEFSTNFPGDFPIEGFSALPANGDCGAGSTFAATSRFNPPPPGDVTPAALSMTGGTLAAGASCTFQATGTVSSGTPPGTYTGHSNAVTATMSGAPVASPTASATLAVGGDLQMTFTKLFTPSVIGQGGSVTALYTIHNQPESGGTATNITFSETSTLFDSAGSPTSDCGGTLNVTAGSVNLSAASLNAAESCQISVPLVVGAAAPSGTHSVATSNLTAGLNGVGSDSFPGASADLTISAIAIEAEYVNSPVLPGGTALLRYTLRNTGPVDATSAFFTHALGGGGAALTASMPPASNSCGGTMSGTTNLLFVGGTIPAAGSCIIDVNVTVPGGTASGNYSSSTSNLVATVNASTVIGNTASPLLTVNSARLLLDKTFAAAHVLQGGTVPMTLTLTNGDAANTATGLAVSDDLGAFVTGATASAPTADDCGGTVTGSGVLSLSGITLAGGASCSVTVNVTIPGGTAPGSYTNTTSTLSGTILSTPVTGDARSANLEVRSADQPTFTKSIAPGTINAGDSATVTYTITNPPGGASLASLGFTDGLGGMMTGLTITDLPKTGICGAGSSISGSSPVQFSGGILAPGDSCSFTVTLQAAAGAAGQSGSSTSSDLTDGGIKVADPVAGALTVNPLPPTLAAAYAPNSIPQGDISTLTYTIDNSASSGIATGLGFTHALPGGLTIASPSGASTGCGGTLTADSGTASMSFAGGSVGAGASCTIQFDVTSTTVGGVSSTTSDLTSGFGTSPGAAASMTVTAAPAPSFSKAFGTSSMVQGDSTNLTFTIDNSTALVEATALAFVDNLPASMVVATPANASTTCSGATLTAATGASSVSLSGGSLAAGASCQVQVDITTDTVGGYINTTEDLTSSLGNSGSATASMTVTAAAAPAFSAGFAPASIEQGRVSTLGFTIDNAGILVPATGLAFDNTLPANVTVATPPNASTTCGGGTVSAVAGDGAFTFSGGDVAAGASCTVSVDVTSLILGTYGNTSGILASSQGPGGTASASLTVAPSPVPGFSSLFAPDEIRQTEVSTLTFTIDNSAAAAPVGGLGFDATLPAGLEVAAGSSPVTTCGGTVAAPAGGSNIGFSGGTVATGSTCTVSVQVTSAIIGSYPPNAATLNTDVGSGALVVGNALSVIRNPIGQVTFVQNSSDDGSFGFSSSEAALNFTIVTAGGTGSHGPVSLNEGTYVVQQTRPAGVGNTSVSCSDGDSSVDVISGTVTLRLSGLESVTCTFDSQSTQAHTTEVINSFLNRRNNLILTNGPSRSRRMERLSRGYGTVERLAYQEGDLGSMTPFSFNFLSLGSGNYKFSTSLSQAQRAHKMFLLAHDGVDETATIVTNRFDMWFEAKYSEFNASRGSRGHFGIAHLGADYLVNENVLAGVVLSYDTMTDESAVTNSSVSGKGWMFGPYVTARLGERLYFDGRIQVGESTNDISPFNTYVDTFMTKRWLVDATISGEFEWKNWTVSPNLSLAYIEENQRAYIDGLGVAIPSQTVSLGQVRFGPTFGTTYYRGNHLAISPTISISGIYNFGNRQGAVIANDTSNETNGLRARIEAGVTLKTRTNTTLEFSANYDGIGRRDYEAWGLGFKLNMPLD